MAHMCPRRWHTRAQRTRDLPTVDEDPKMKSRIGSHFAAALLVLTALPGCMQSRVEESRELHTKIQKDESVVILAKPQIEGAATEDGFMDCVSRGLAGNGPDAISVQSNTTFVDSMFPWFEPGTAPTRPEGIATLLTRPGVSERVAASGVRYIVWLDGGTQKTDGGGSIACGAAPGAAGCIGFGSETGEVRGQCRHERHRDISHRRSRRPAAIYRSRAESCVQSHGGTAANVLHGQRRH
jgi:hypothetical protein